MIYKVYRWEWDEDPGFFYGRWVRAFETDNEEMMIEGVNDLQETSVRMSTTENRAFAVPPVAIFKTVEESDDITFVA